jgi:hypothetical protein
MGRIMTSGGVFPGAKGISTCSGQSPYEKYNLCTLHGYVLRATCHHAKNGAALCPVEYYPGKYCHKKMMQWPRANSETKQRIKKLLRLEVPPILVKVPEAR